MDSSPKPAHSLFQGSISQEAPHDRYQNPHNRPLTGYGRSLSSDGQPSPRLYGQVTPPGRPSSPSRHHRRTHSAPKPVKVGNLG
jgi:hypothetical protein